jgi:hypothetical protein
LKIVAALLMSVVACFSQSVPLQWDASPDAATMLLNYRLYAHTNGLDYTTRTNALVRVGVGTNLTAQLDLLKPGVWTFAASAITTNGIESGFSNFVVVEVARAPGNMRTVIVQQTTNLTEGVWHDVGFLRLKIP